MRLEGCRTVVTGGAGFIGSWLCERLLGEGASVWCVDSFVTGSPDNVAHLAAHPTFTLVESDIGNGVPDPGRVDLVLHLACPDPPARRRLSAEVVGSATKGTVNALELAERHGARFVLASAPGLHGDPLERFAEATTMAYHRARGVDVAIARVFDTYGPRMSLLDERTVPTFLREARSGAPLTVAGDGSRLGSLCWVEDIVDGLIRLARSTERGPVDLGDDAGPTDLDVARTVVALTGSSSGIRHVDRDQPRPRPPEVGYALRALGWMPTMSLDEGLKRTVRWLEESGG